MFSYYNNNDNNDNSIVNAVAGNNRERANTLPAARSVLAKDIFQNPRSSMIVGSGDLNNNNNNNNNNTP